MTDDRIDYHRNRLRGVPLADLGRIADEVLRDVVREAQSEQDGHIYLLREQIARDSAQIERMRAALVDVRPLIGNMEKMLRDVLNLTGQPRSADECVAFARLHVALRMIDEAMGESNDR